MSRSGVKYVVSLRQAPVALIVIALCTSLACTTDARADAERTLATRDTSSQFVVTVAQSVVLGPEHVADLMRTCGRGVPSGLTGYWAPDSQTLSHLEARLPAMLEAHVRPSDRPRLARIPIIRQYMGFVRSGRRVIYVNGWPDTGLPDTRRWTNAAGGGCGGGPLVFGVLYDPDTRTFSDFAGNGDM